MPDKKTRFSDTFRQDFLTLALKKYLQLKCMPYAQLHKESVVFTQLDFAMHD